FATSSALMSLQRFASIKSIAFFNAVIHSIFLPQVYFTRAQGIFLDFFWFYLSKLILSVKKE
ncbi:MAG: hypothetical protein J6C25_07865, partial [Treponema sp.]|nr:hypothetical protein [Treponema sp.]